MLEWICNILQSLLDFSFILNSSIAASWLILAVVVLRFLLRKAPKWINVVLWGLVAVRLLFPLSIESAFSLVPSAQTVPEEILRFEGDKLREPAYLDVISNPNFSTDVSIELEQTVDRVQLRMMDMTFMWILGVMVLLLYAVISYWSLYRKVRTAVRYQDNIFQSEHVGSPFVLGIIRPRIYLPFHITEQNLKHVVSHEQAHIRHKDHWWKPLGFFLLTVHWFNPLMWLAYVLFCRDIELACDEKVIKELGNEQRADYTQALVACSVKHSMISACPIAFGEVGVKDRVKSIMNYKKPTFWIMLVSVVACVVVAVCFLTNPKEITKEIDLQKLFENRIAVSDNIFSPKEFPFLISVDQLLEEKELSEEAIYSRNIGSDGYEYVYVTNDIKITNINGEMKEVYLFFNDMLVQVTYDIPVTEENREMVCQILYDQVIALNLPNQTNFSLKGLQSGVENYRWEDDEQTRLCISSPTTLENEPDIIAIDLIISREVIKEKLANN